MKKAVLAVAIAGIVMITTMELSAFASSKVDQINVRYVSPRNPAHQAIYERLKEERALERLQRLLSPFRLPKTLQVWLAGCDGEPDAFYHNATITICYEYVHELWQNLPKDTTPGGTEPIDTIVGPLYEITLHEVGHALFDMLDLPVFGREEDAADQLAAYIMLQFGDSLSRRLITGTAFAYKTDEKRTAWKRSIMDYASEHGTPAQRAFNVLCIAYGANKRLFRDIVRHGYLPRRRARYCNEEYEQVEHAFKTLVLIHVDPELAEEIFGGN